MGAGRRERESDRPTDTCQHDAFGKQLADDSRACRAERRTNGYFARAMRAAHDEQVRHVGARHEENEESGRDKHIPGGMDAYTNVMVIDRYRAKPDIRVRRGIAPDKFRPDALELTNGVHTRHTRFETAEHIQLPRPAQLSGRARRHRAERLP